MITELNRKPIERFVVLARAGAHPGASSGEKIAHRIAQAFATIGDDICGMDQGAIQGAALLLQAMGGPWRMEAQKVEVYNLLRKAAE